MFIRERLGPVKECYEHALKKDATLSGKVVMHWTIEKNGTTRGISVENNTMPTAEVGPCIGGLISKWHFPPPGGGTVDVSFPFVFQATPAKKEGPGPEPKARR
jgi:hypothetical protein